MFQLPGGRTAFNLAFYAGPAPFDASPVPCHVEYVLGLQRNAASRAGTKLTLVQFFHPGHSKLDRAWLNTKEERSRTVSRSNTAVDLRLILGEKAEWIVVQEHLSTFSVIRLTISSVSSISERLPSNQGPRSFNN
ncbi:unnamed protein product [Fusarium graminearum]|uniref:Uncharacterized protein n=1 Tax=Gibberella zeae TaxID=5518 RepID=A0A4E9DU26_GIBZA|nr:unnamed protein product [Fusarium graminearum]CAG1966839.1 unnamed protein product [Fusarium graminearum]CAG1968194.1 unnamed protein product [Fusarium graminearum]